MAFAKDFKDGKFAEKLIANFLLSRNINVPVLELGRARQSEGDLEIHNYTVEVKFDRLAGETGNLCFELSNGKGNTGIASTLAKEIYYVVPDNIPQYIIYGFNTDSLRKYLYDKSNANKFKIVNGGDRKAFTLLIVSRKIITEDKIPFLEERILDA